MVKTTKASYKSLPTCRRKRNLNLKYGPESICDGCRKISHALFYYNFSLIKSYFLYLKMSYLLDSASSHNHQAQAEESDSKR